MEKTLDSILYYQTDYNTRKLKKIAFLDFPGAYGTIEVSTKGRKLSRSAIMESATHMETDLEYVYSNASFEHYDKYYFCGEKPVSVLGNLQFKLVSVRSDNSFEYEYLIPLMSVYDVEGDEIFFNSAVHAGFYSEKDMRRVSAMMGSAIVEMERGAFYSAFVKIEVPFELPMLYKKSMQDRHIEAIEELRRSERI